MLRTDEFADRGVRGGRRGQQPLMQQPRQLNDRGVVSPTSDYENAKTPEYVFTFVSWSKLTNEDIWQTIPSTEGSMDPESYYHAGSVGQPHPLSHRSISNFSAFRITTTHRLPRSFGIRQLR